MGVFVIIGILAVGLAAVAAFPNGGRVVGGVATTIEQYPYSAALLHGGDFINYHQRCGGVIVNNRAVITAANCVLGEAPIRWRVRVGSTYANSGGIVYNAHMIIVHNLFNREILEYDIAMIRSATHFTFTTNVRPASIAGATYNLPDNSVVWATGWGATRYQGPHSEVLRHTQVWVINQNVCDLRYREIGRALSHVMLCTGWLNVGGRDQCSGDNGSPVVTITSAGHVVVGIRSWGVGCGQARWPGVSTRVSTVADWITLYA